MANNSFLMGMMPAPQGSDPPDIMWMPKKVSSAAAMFINSPIWVVAGYVDTAVAGHTNLATNGITGTVTNLLDSNGSPVTNLATTAAGTVGFTYKSDQRYRMKVDSTDYTDLLAGAEYMDLTAETGSADTSTAQNAGFSQRMLDGSSHTATAANGQMVLGARTRQQVNAASTLYTEVFCTINPTFYQNPGV